MTIDIDSATTNSLKAIWDALRGRGNSLDYERAVFLYNVLVERLHEDIETLKRFIVVELEEFAGKRVSAFVRMVHALDVIDDEETWMKLGGSSVVLLSRVDGRKRSRIYRRLSSVLHRTGRVCVSEPTFRNILKDVLGEDGYQDLLIETRGEGHPRFNYRSQCVIYQQEILRMVQDGLIQKRDLSVKVRMLLGLNGLSQSQRRRAA